MTNKLSSVLALSFSLLSACGAVSSPSQPDGDDDGMWDDLQVHPFDPASGTQDPVAVSPVAFDPPRAATTPNALAHLDLATTALPLAHFIEGTGEARDVSEQRFITTTNEPVTLEVALAAPSVMATRTIVTTQGRENGPLADSPRALCSNASFVSTDPRCRVDNLSPAPDTRTAASTPTWKIWVYSEATGEAVPGCFEDGVAECTLPAGTGRAYRIVTAIDRVPELWDGTPLGWGYLGGLEFIGRNVTLNVCRQFLLISGSSYCASRFEYYGAQGIDAASLAFGDIAVSITANGFPHVTPLSGVVWNAGENDFPAN